MQRIYGRSRSTVSPASRLNEAFGRYFGEQTDGEEDDKDKDDTARRPPDEDDEDPAADDGDDADLSDVEDSEADMEPMTDTPPLPRDIRQDPREKPAPLSPNQPTASQSIQARYTKGAQDYFLNKERSRFTTSRIPDFRYGPPQVSVVVR